MTDEELKAINEQRRKSARVMAVAMTLASLMMLAAAVAQAARLLGWRGFIR